MTAFAVYKVRAAASMPTSINILKGNLGLIKAWRYHNQATHLMTTLLNHYISLSLFLDISFWFNQIQYQLYLFDNIWKLDPLLSIFMKITWDIMGYVASNIAKNYTHCIHSTGNILKLCSNCNFGAIKQKLQNSWIIS